MNTANRIKSIFLVFLLASAFLVGQDTTTVLAHRIGFIFKQSNLYSDRKVRFHPNDIYRDGLYTLFAFNTRHFRLYNSMFATTDSLEALKGGHKKVKGILGYTNQALVAFRFAIDDWRLNGLLGREYLRSGYSQGGSLLLGDESRPFDQVNLTIGYRGFTGQLVQIQLDKWEDQQRYLSYHGLRWDYGRKFSVMVAEALLYTGERRNVEFPFLNPVLFWTPVMVNDDNMLGNGLLYGGFQWRVVPAVKLYLEGLIDDYQVNRRSKGDLEPNELGLILGLAGEGFLDATSRGWLEYTRITNRTYQTTDPTEAYLHRGFPIGHYLGNDFDLWQLHYAQAFHLPWLRRKFQSIQSFKPYLEIGYLRDGANGLDTPFDTPWMDSTITLETGYSEPFPTPPITYVTELESGVEVSLVNGSFMTVGFYGQRRELQGEVKTTWRVAFRLWVVLEKGFRY